MATASIHREILSLTLPSIVTNITTPLLGLADTALTGHMGSPVYLAAIAVGSTMFNLLYWSFGFLRMSASGLTAQAYGAGNLHEQSLTLRRELLVALASGVAMIALSPWLGPLLIRFADPTAESALPAMRYFAITVWGAPAVLATYALTGWFLGRQNSRVPMWTALAVNLSNIAVSVALVFGAGMRIEGVAIGTLSAQWLGAAVLLLCAARQRMPHVALHRVLERRAMSRFAGINSMIFLRTVCLIAVTFWFTRAGAAQGTVVLAVNALLMQLFLLFSFVMDGFAFAAEAMTGRYIGAGDALRLRATVRATFLWGAGLAIFFTAVYWGGGEWFLGLLTDDGDVVHAAAEYAPWACAIPLAGFAAFAWDGVYVGAILNKVMLLAMGSGAAAFFICYAALFPTMRNHGLWVAFLAYLGARSLSETIMWPRAYKHLLLSQSFQSTAS